MDDWFWYALIAICGWLYIFSATVVGVFGALWLFSFVIQPIYGSGTGTTPIKRVSKRP